MPSPLQFLFPQLPTELCDQILAEAINGRSDGDHWLDLPLQIGDLSQRDVSLLRVLSQVNRGMRAAMMPLIWTNISLHVEKKSIGKIIGLRQLNNNLNASGPLPGPKHYLQSIDFRIDTNCLRPYDEHPDYWEPGDYVHDVHQKELRSQLGFENDESAVSLSLRKLSKVLINCACLSALKWKGWIVPDPMLLMNLSQYPSLKDISVDLDSPYWFSLEKWNMPEPATMLPRGISAPRFARSFAFNSVRFVAQPMFYCTGCTCCDALPPIDKRLDSREGEAAVALLTAYRFTNQLALGDRFLLYQRWMLPLWAQLERLEFDLSYYQPRTRRSREDGFESLEPEMDHQMLQAAQIFPHLLDRSHLIRDLLHSSRSRSQSHIDKIAKAVFDLIHMAPELSNWAPWFPKWNNRPYEEHVHSSGPVRTKSIMRLVARVLVQRFTFTRVTRRMYSTPPPSEDWMQALEINAGDFESDSE